MKKYVYAVRDNKVGFLTPTVEDADAIAIRAFAFSVNNSGGIVGFAPSDFDLYRIGCYDTETSVISPEVPPVLICSGGSVFGVKEASHAQ